MKVVIFSFSPKAERGSDTLEKKLIEVHESKVSWEEISGRKFVMFKIDDVPQDILDDMYLVYGAEEKGVKVFTDKNLTTLLKSEDSDDCTDYSIIVADVYKAPNFINEFVKDASIFVKEMSEFGLRDLVSFNNWLRGIFKIDRISLLTYLLQPSLTRRSYHRA